MNKNAFQWDAYRPLITVRPRQRPLDRNPFGQRPSLNTAPPPGRDPLDRDPLGRDPPDKDSPGQRPPGQRTSPPHGG